MMLMRFISFGLYPPKLFVTTMVALVALALLSVSPASAQSLKQLARQDTLKWEGNAINVAWMEPYYKGSRYRAVWTDRGGLNDTGEELIKVLKNAGTDGLDPDDYIGPMEKKLRAASGDDIAAAELFLSHAFMRLARDLWTGRTTPSVSEPDIVISRKKSDPKGWLTLARRKGPKEAVEALRPPHRQYAALRQLLAKTKNRNKRRKIITNMERWRWLPRSLGENHVLVNQAAFEMLSRKNGKTVDRRRVIIGKPYHKTPMFSHTISLVEFNPTWTIPQSIAGNEYLKKLRRDPNYLEKNGYKIYTSWKEDAPAMKGNSIDWSSVRANKFPYRIVQQPGERNALGKVKFLFPNTFDVYLHDTPSRKLFSQNNRALSHGCIRVDKPLEFAKVLFSLDRRTRTPKIDKLLATEETQPVELSRKGVPIHLTYFTMWIDEKGKVRNFKDVYGRDKLVAGILFGGV